MNRFAVLFNSKITSNEREALLGKALGCSAGNIRIEYPLPNVSLAWSGDVGLTSMVSSDGCFALAHGSAHRSAGLDKAQVAVDDVNGLSRLLLSRVVQGKSFLAGLAGSFIGVAADQAGRILLSGDPSGNRFPYFAIRDEELAVSNHPLVCARLHRRMQVDRGLEDFFLVYGFLPDGRTLYRGVQQLLKGSTFIFEPGGWRHELMPVATKSETHENVPESGDQLYDRLYETLISCTEDQLASASEVGVLLGGFDSALVATLLHRLGKRVRTYSFRYAETRFNQPHTDTLSEYLGCEHTWIDINPEVIASGLENYAESFIQPTNWLNYVIQTVHVCESMRRDGIDTAYSGDGCDTIFLGYPGTYKRTRAFSRLPQLPLWLVDALTSLLAWPALDRRMGHPYRVAMNLLRAMARPMPARAFLTFRVMDEITINALRGNDSPAQDESIEHVVNRLAEPFGALSIQRLGYSAKGFVSPNRTKLIASADVAGVRVHAPYLHPDLRQFAAWVPDHLLRERGQSDICDYGKICLMRMAERHRLLPSEVIYQEKLAAVDSPIDEWFSSALRHSLDSTLMGLPFTPDSKMMDALVKTTGPEQFYKRHIGSTRVISDAISLLATYGAMCGALKKP